MVVLPVYRNSYAKSNLSQQITFANMTKKWFDYFWRYFLNSFPIVWVSISVLEILYAITMVWHVIASYIAYRMAIHPWMKEITVLAQQNE
jgi:hypothetical protein